MVDVGIFHQIISNLAEGNGWIATITGVENFWSDHFSPSLALLVPFFKLTGNSPLVLAVVHAGLVFGGVGAWVFLGERLPNLSPDRRARIAAAALIFGIVMDSLWANLRWGFHESAIAFCAQSWAWAFIFLRWRGGRGIALACLLLAVSAGSKEILLLDGAVAFFILAYNEFKSAAKPTAVLSATLALLCVTAFVAFTSHDSPEKKNYFIRYYGYLGSDSLSALAALFRHPLRVFEVVGGAELLRFVRDVLTPWLALPLLWLFGRRGDPRPRTRVHPAVWAFAILPSFMAMALSTVIWLRRPSHHYVLELWPLLAALTLFALARIRVHRAPELWAFSALLFLGQDPWRQLIEYARAVPGTAAIRTEMRGISREYSVVADEMTGPWLAARTKVSRWPDLKPFLPRCPDYRVLSPTSPSDELGPVSFKDICRDYVLSASSPDTVFSGGWRVYRHRPPPR